MTRITICRASDDPMSDRRPAPGRQASILAALAGIGVGLTVGFLVGEIAGPAAERTLTRGGVTRKGWQAVADLVGQAQSVLDGDVVLRDCHLQVVPVGRGRLELHGWVDDRRSRARAAHLVSDAVRADELINCLLVRGEDDTLPDDIDPDGDELQA